MTLSSALAHGVLELEVDGDGLFRFNGFGVGALLILGFSFVLGSWDIRNSSPFEIDSRGWFCPSASSSDPELENWSNSLSLAEVSSELSEETLLSLT